MFAIDRLLLVAALLLLVGIASSRFSARVGLPVLVLFIGVGMLAGSEGVGGIWFDDYTLAHGFGTLALAIILYDGGLRTSFSSIRPALAPALSLATVGVLLTALITGAAATYILGLPLLVGLLLGSIIGSTDAAAVFSILRSGGLRLPPRLASTLEVESGSNDPMAIFLTVGLLEVLLGRMELGAGLLVLFIKQMALGSLFGAGVGKGAAYLLNRVELGAAGLYPVFAAAAGLLAYGVTAVLGGSGFLAVYVAGIVLGNSRIVFHRGILLFHDGAAWLAQIGMFVLLGLLSFPSRLLQVAGPALLVSAVLILVARPVAVAVSLLPFRFPPRELAFLSLAGLKGAVPIVLGIYPLLFGLPDAELLFNVVFFVVLVAAITEGWSLPPLARALGLQTEAAPEPPVSLEITSLKDVDADIVAFGVKEQDRIAGRLVRDLALPDAAVIAMITREARVIPPRGSTRIEPGDHIFFVLDRENRPTVERLFTDLGPEGGASPAEAEFPLRGDTSLADLEEFYGVRVAEEDAEMTIDELLRSRLADRLEVGRGVDLRDVKLRVLSLSDGRVDKVSVVIAAAPPRE
ncbi:MAG TPA: potassium/proton antiporter [Longimicrobium sp.]|nr:potassium/proton antiporter [Longimicrobium sp.]